MSKSRRERRQADRKLKAARPKNASESIQAMLPDVVYGFPPESPFHQFGLRSGAWWKQWARAARKAGKDRKEA